MSFRPPFCPNRTCIHHHNESRSRWYIKTGSHRSKREGRVQRFKCRACGNGFSSATFSVHYWTQHHLDLRRILLSLISASGIRDMAREFCVTDKVIINRLSRLARQSIGMLATLMEGRYISEDIAIDGFESFVHSQYFPNNYHLAIGAESQMFYTCDYAQMRRKGRMTEYQKKRRETLYKRFPIPGKEIERSFDRCFQSIFGIWEGNAQSKRVLRSDEKQEYSRILKANTEWQAGLKEGSSSHIRVSSKAVRNTANPLMSVNYFDRELRKDQANHVRQTLQWSRSVNNSMDRMMIYGAYHNFWKQFRINELDDRVHGEVAGIPRGDIEKQKRRFFTRRYFFTHLMPDVSQMMTWFRLWKTPTHEMKLEARPMLCA